MSGVNGYSVLRNWPPVVDDEPALTAAEHAVKLRARLEKRLLKSAAPTWVQANVLRQLAYEAERRR